MPIPIVTIPEHGAIATRPRRQPLYDTEGDNDDVGIVAKLMIFRNYTAFQVANLSLTKTKGRDVNMDGPGGSLPKGDYFHWYGLTCPVSVRNSNLTVVGSIGLFEQILRIRHARWLTFRFSETPFIRAQQDEIPLGTGIKDIMTTHTQATTMWVANGALRRENRYDVTLDGFPTEITDQETFGVDLESDTGLQPTPDEELYHTPHLWGTLLKGIRG